MLIFGVLNLWPVTFLFFLSISPVNRRLPFNQIFLFKPNHFCTSICHVQIIFSPLPLSLAFVQAPRLHVFTGGQGPSRSNQIVSGRQCSYRSCHYIFAREYAKDCRDGVSNRRPHPQSNTDTLDRSATIDRLYYVT